MREKQDKDEMEQATSGSRDIQAGVVAVGALVICILLVVGLRLGLGMTDGATTVALLLVPLLVYGIISGRLRELTLPGGLSAKFDELKTEVKKTETELETTKEEIRAIQFALKGILTKHETGHLERLNTGANEQYLIRWEPDLYRYLHRLDGLDFIQPHKDKKDGLMTIENEYKTDKPPEERPEFNLKEYVYITDTGKLYLNTLNRILEKAKVQRREAGR